jgi:hypothetical protein
MNLIFLGGTIVLFSILYLRFYKIFYNLIHTIRLIGV